jgi:hypothetical protein
MMKHFLRIALAGGLVLTAALFLGGCENPAGDGGPSAARVEADKFRDSHSEILEKSLGRITLNDEAAIEEALEAYEGLSDKVKAELAEEKAKLDSLKARLNNRRGSSAALRSWLEGLPDNTVYDPYYAAYTGTETPAAIYRALELGGKYVTLDLSKSGVTGFESNFEAGRERVVCLILPDSLEATGDGSASGPVFSGFTNLKTLEGAGPLTLGAYAFYNSASIETVDLPKAAAISTYAFALTTALTTVNLPEVVDVGLAAFYHSTGSLATVNLPKAVNIDASAFNGCTGLTSIDLPEAAAINYHTFYLCGKLISANLPKAVTIAENAFEQCTSLTTVNLPKAVTIKQYSFRTCTALTAIDLPVAETIGAGAFMGCLSLETVNLPKIPSLTAGMLSGCPLTTVTLGAVPPAIGPTLFQGKATTPNKTITFYVPDISVYTAAGTPWSDKVNKSNQDAGYYWDSNSTTRDNLTVALAAIGG